MQQSEAKTSQSRIAAILNRMKNTNVPLYRYMKPEVLKHLPLNLTDLRAMPWRERRSDMTDYFNYGFNEVTFNHYTYKLQSQHELYGNEIQKNYLSILNDALPPFKDSTIKDKAPIDYGGLNVPFDRKMLSRDLNTDDHQLMDHIFFQHNIEDQQQEYSVNELILYGNEYFQYFHEDIRKKVQNDFDLAIQQERTIYNFQEVVEVLEQFKKRKQSSQSNNQFDMRGSLRSTPDMITQLLNHESLNNLRGQHSVQKPPIEDLEPEVQKNEDKEDKKKKKKKDKKSKKEKKDKKDKKKHKHKKKHKKEYDENFNLDDNKIIVKPAEISGSDDSESFSSSNKYVGFVKSYRSLSISQQQYVPSMKAQPVILSSSTPPQEVPQQGNQGVTIEDRIHQATVKHVQFTDSPLSPSLDEKPQQSIEIQQPAQRQRREGAWQFSQIHGILQGQAKKRRF